MINPLKLCCLAVCLLAVAAPVVAQPLSRTARPVQPAPALVLQGNGPATTALADTTIDYYDISRGGFIVSIEPGDASATGIFFTAPFTGSVDRVDFALSRPAPGMNAVGSGTLRLKMFSASPFLPFSPRSTGMDSLDIPFANLEASFSITPRDLDNQVDVTSRSFNVVDGQDYYLEFSVVNASSDARVDFLYDGGSDDSTNTDYYPARTFVYVETDTTYFTLRDSSEPTFQNLNLILELQLTRRPPPPAGAKAVVQFIHNIPDAGPVDLYVGDSLVVNDLGFQEASTLREVPAGTQTLAVVAGNAPDAGSPLVSSSIPLAENRTHVALALGSAAQQDLSIVAQAIGASESEQEKISLFFAHGGLDTGPLSARILGDPVVPLVSGLAFGSIAGPIGLSETELFAEIEVNDSGGALLDVFKLDVSDFASSLFSRLPLVLVASGIQGSTETPFTLIAVDAGGNVSVAGLCPGRVCVSTAVEVEGGLPATFALHANYPNPFNPVTTIRFDLATPAYTTLDVYDLLGRRVATLVAEPLAAGRYTVPFEAAGLSSGVYLYRLTSGSFTQQRMLTLVN